MAVNTATRPVRGKEKEKKGKRKKEKERNLFAGRPVRTFYIGIIRMEVPGALFSDRGCARSRPRLERIRKAHPARLPQ